MDFIESSSRAVAGGLQAQAMDGRPTPARNTEELIDVVGRALENDVAHRGLVRPLLNGGQAARLSDFELDLGDWGFTYGLAWAAARAQDPDEPDHSVAARALEAAAEVFRVYCDGEEPAVRGAHSNGHLNGDSLRVYANAHDGRAADTREARTQAQRPHVR
jgi:hypothetical protein